MKTPKYLLTILIIFSLTSCAKYPFYQVYKVDPVKDIEYKSNKLIYEDDNCKVTYNFWANGGNIGFDFYNKTSKNIYLNLKESFFILNGIAYDYYKSRVYTKMSDQGQFELMQSNLVKLRKKTASVASTGLVVSYNEEPVICIPSNSSKLINEYKINNSIYRDCDLYKYPTKKQINTLSFSKENSPFVFSNRIAYYIENTNDIVHFENQFYVTEITNYPESEIVIEKPEIFCEQKGDDLKSLKDPEPFKFYIKYTEVDDWKH